MIVEQKTTAFIRRCGIFSDGDRVLVAVSGGPDSTALLHILYGLREEFSLNLEVAHLQHGIRGGEAREDARFVARLAAKLQLPFHLREIDLPNIKSAAGKGNLEALARAHRYRFFGEVMAERKLDKVATAHTRDDQAETVLMWFLRGAGSTGLSGMAPVHQTVADGHAITIIRPLLETSKSKLLRYLNERHLDYRLDRTNQDPALLRNWLRLDLLPRIQGRYDTRVPARLAQQAEIFRDENALLDALARERQVAIVEAGGLSRAALLEQPKALQRRILRLWIEQCRGHVRGLEFVHIEDGLRLIIEGPPQGRVSIPGGWELVREYNSLKLEKRLRTQRRVCYNYLLEIGTMLSIAEAGLEIRSEPLPVPPERLPDNLMEAVFDTAELEGALSVRNFRRGDRFQPLGMSGHKKVKDLFIEKRVPLSIRARWPLLVSGEDILWIPGYARSAAGRVSRATTAALRLNARQIRD